MQLLVMEQLMKLRLIFFVLLTFLVVACSPAPQPAAGEATSAGMATDPILDPAPVAEPSLAPTAIAVEDQFAEPTTSPENATPDSPQLVITPFEVTYFTPTQGEGPYYTVNKPADRDNDLANFAGGAGLPAGEILEFFGKVYGADGMPIGGAVIEIWQTDNKGVYLHPNDPATGERDPNFQFYGEAITAEDGSYRFRTILPGRYEPRPQHIHFKVLVDSRVVLTSQLYFLGDPSLETDSLFTNAAGESEHLLIRLYSGEDANGQSILMGERDIVLNIN